MTVQTKIVERVNGRDFLRVILEIRENDPRGISDGFSVTGELYEAHGKQTGKYRAARRWDADISGCIHDDILRIAPSLAPMVAVHLAELDGTPMHAAVNGWYFYRGGACEYETRHYGADYAARLGTDHQRAARALHIDAAELPEGLDRAGFEAFAESLRPHWAQMAADARALFDSLPTIEETRGYDMFGKAIR